MELSDELQVFDSLLIRNNKNSLELNSLTASFFVPFDENQSIIANKSFSNQENIINNGQLKFSDINLNNEKGKKQILDDISDLMKCYICFNRVKNPKMCNYCHRLVCADCIVKWLNNKNTCGICRHQITSILDFSDVPFMPKIDLLLTFYNNLEKKTRNLEDSNEKLKEKLFSNRCIKHNEQILYYCFDCNEKLCGKCTSFTNKESKKHDKHKIFEYSEIEKSKYLDILNLMENTQEQIKIIENDLNKCEEIKQNNIVKLDKQKVLFDIIYKEIENNYKENNTIITDNSNKLTKIQKKLNKKYNKIKDLFSKIESLDKPIDNLNIEDEKSSFEKYKTKIIKVEDNMNQIKEKNYLLELKSFKFLFYQTYESIIKEKNLKMAITNPIKINFLLKATNELAYIIFPIAININIEENKIKKKRKIYLIPLMQINDKIYEKFKKSKRPLIPVDDNKNIKKNENNLIEDEEDKSEIINIVNCFEKNENIIKEDKENKIKDNQNVDENDDYQYILSIKLADLIKGTNKFELFISYYNFQN